MKPGFFKFLIYLGCVLISLTDSVISFGQAPQKMSFQAVIRNSSNNLIKSSKISVRVSVLQGSSNGNSVYSQIIQDSTNSNGLISFEIGGVGFDNIDWSKGNYYLKLESDNQGGNNFEAFSTQQLLSVPYALYAQNSGTPGPKGDTGLAGTNGKNSLIRIVKEMAGTNCAEGGIRVEAGLDNNSNGVLEFAEVNQATTRYLCNGIAGKMPAGNQVGEMQYWDGKDWVMISPGIKGQTLTFCDGKPIWGPCPIVVPKLNSSQPSFITTSTAVSGGSVVDDGGASITAKGVCFNTMPNPTVANFKTTDGNGTGAYTSNLSGLISNTTYYVRAYATNSAGTGYGPEFSFTTSVPQVLTVGQTYQGGVVAYLLQPGDSGYDANIPHGIIAALSDQSQGLPWYNGNDVLTGADANGLFKGKNNTSKIISVQGSGNYAAKLCDDLVLNGFNDWYLPSKEELNKLFLNRNLIGSFALNYYWSSTESSFSEAWTQSFNSGAQTDLSKFSSNYIRAIRSF